MPDAPSTPRVPLGVVVREWGRIGALGFGGPPAHVALLRELVVERRRWMSAREFEDANAACQLLPGPASTQLCIYCARRVGGTAGGLAGGLAFVLPGLVLVLLISAVALGDDPAAWVRGFGAGAAAAVVVVVVQAGLAARARQPARPPRRRGVRAAAYLAAGAASAAVLGALVVVVLLVCGLVELAWTRRHTAAIVAWPALLVLAARGAEELPPLAWTAVKVGALSFGGGFVIIPLMQGDAIAHDWMTSAGFANAVAFGQITPGPVTHTVALVGWAAAGPLGALLATVIAFAPSFLAILLGGAAFERLRGEPLRPRVPRRRRTGRGRRDPRGRADAGGSARGRLAVRGPGRRRAAARARLPAAGRAARRAPPRASRRRARPRAPWLSSPAMPADDLREEAAEVLSRLVRFKTVNPPGDERACQEWLSDYLTEAGFECELLARPRTSAPTSSPACAARSPGRCSATSRTSTPCSPIPRTGATTPGAARFTTASCGAAARWT